MSAQSTLDSYPSCDAGQDEAGAEVVYRLTLNNRTRIRMIVVDKGSVDVDIHLLAGTAGNANDCVERHDRIIQGPLDAGDYLVVVDTFVSGGTPRAGEFVLAIVECDVGDPDCD